MADVSGITMRDFTANAHVLPNPVFKIRLRQFNIIESTIRTYLNLKSLRGMIQIISVHNMELIYAFSPNVNHGFIPRFDKLLTGVNLFLG